MTRDDLIDQLYAEVRKEIPITREAYGNSLYGWDIVPVMIDGLQIGVRIMCGHEVHHQLDPRASLRHARRIIAQYVAEPLARLGYLTTRSDDAGLPFLQRMGFHVTSRQGAISTLRLDKLIIK
jgi:hypothetical protein